MEQNSNNKNNNSVFFYGSFHKKHSKKSNLPKAKESESDIDPHLSMREKEKKTEIKLFDKITHSLHGATNYYNRQKQKSDLTSY